MIYCRKFICKKHDTCLYAPKNDDECKVHCSSHRCDFCVFKGRCADEKRQRSVRAKGLGKHV